MRACVLALLSLAPALAAAQIGCQKWADGSETCYYADGRVSEGRRQIDGSMRWSERAPAASGLTAPTPPAEVPQTQDSRHWNAPHRIRHPWETGGPRRFGLPPGAGRECAPGNVSPGCDAAAETQPPQ
ncbi:MAG: hypothetical protein DIU74_003500 [Pseudomonadota bacterium]